jgi:CDP-6-deoxy-D-xylo-4-hexulose-3-dehydrase
MDVDAEIQSLITNLRKEFQVPPYLYNNFEKFIPGITNVYYSGPYFDDREIIAGVKSILLSKWMTAGEDVKEFEHSFARKNNQNFCVAVNSASANLVMIAALKRFYSWKDEDEVIVSVVGFPTTYSVLLQNNLVPVFIDIEMDTLNFDLELIEEKITPKTRAIFLSPVLGNPPNIDRLLDICERYDLRLILDGCDSLGSRWNGKLLTEYVAATSCSFYAAHEICTFEGGAITSNNRELINIARKMINWGRDCVCSGVENLLPNGICNRRFDNWIPDIAEIIDHKYLFTEIGYNLKMLEFQGAIGIVQLEKLTEICQKRNESYNQISELFVEYINGIKIPTILSGSYPTPFGTAVICKSKEQKDKLVKHLEMHKIQSRNYFAGNLLAHRAYKHLGNWKDYPQANKIYSQTFFIGAAPHYTKEIFDYIEEVLKKYEN